MKRRHFIATGPLVVAGLSAPATAAVASATRPQPDDRRAPVAILRPARLRLGDRVGLVSPATAAFQQEDIDIARESLAGLGLAVEIGRHARDRHGSLGGRDADRAADINAFFADPDIRAVLAVRGGWGTARLLPLLDYDLIRRNPKVLLGYSDITALLNGIHARTGLVTFHGPNASGRWDEFSVDLTRRVLFDAEAVAFANARSAAEQNVLTPTRHRVRTITPGRATGRLLGGNLTVLTAILGSPYVPDFTDAILFLEDIGEDWYRVDRMMTSLKLAGILSQIRGFIFGTCAECEPGSGFASLTPEEIFADHIAPLGVPAWSGAMIGHGHAQWTLPVGEPVVIDADAGTVAMTRAAVD